MTFANNPKDKTGKKKTAKKKIVKKKTAKKKDEKKPESTRPTAGGFPKIVTEAKIQAVSYDVTSGSNVKFKDIKFTSGQHEKLVAIAQDGRARVQLSIVEINPPLTPENPPPPAANVEPTFEDAVRGAQKTKKKNAKKADAKKAKDAGDGSKLPI